MYIWKIEELKDQLSHGTLPESESFKYLMASTIIYLLAMIQYMTPNHYDTISGLVALIVGVLGLWFIYKCNGGENGQHLLERYMAIGWVISVRFLVIFFVPAVFALLLIQEFYFGGVQDETTLMDVVFLNATEVIYILLVAKHINNVAVRANA